MNIWEECELTDNDENSDDEDINEIYVNERNAHCKQFGL